MARAHIIPRSFFKQLRIDDQMPKLLSVGPDSVTEHVYQSGIWDSNIVCRECEARFGPYDDHGIRVLRGVTKCPIFKDKDDGNELSYVLQNASYARLKMFFLTVLWRAHWASHRFFSQVDLGPYADKLAVHIRSDTAPPPEEFSVYLYHLRDFPYPGSMMPVIRQSTPQINLYRFYFPNVVAVIVVGNKQFPAWMKPWQLKEQEPHHLVFLPFFGSFEDGYLQGMLGMMGSAATLPRNRTR